MNEINTKYHEFNYLICFGLLAFGIYKLIRFEPCLEHLRQQLFESKKID